MPTESAEQMRFHGSAVFEGDSKWDNCDRNSRKGEHARKRFEKVEAQYRGVKCNGHTVLTESGACGLCLVEYDVNDMSTVSNCTLACGWATFVVEWARPCNMCP